MSEQHLEVEGTIKVVLPGTMFRVLLDNNKHEVLAHICGKMRKRWVRLTAGDRVPMEMSPYDLTKGRSPGAQVVGFAAGCRLEFAQFGLGPRVLTVGGSGANGFHGSGCNGVAGVVPFTTDIS